MLDTLRDYLIKARKTENVRAVLFCSEGDYFCSGLDYSDLVECEEDKMYKILVTNLIATLR